METRGEEICESWLKPIVSLVGERDFGEAYALAAYFPGTRNRQLVQFAALLGQNKVLESSTFLEKLGSETQSLVAEFITILSQVHLDLLEIGSQAIQNEYYELADFCIEFQLRVHPETTPAVLDWLLRIAKQVLATDDFDRGRTYLERVIELDNSPEKLILCAEVVLKSRTEISYLYKTFASDLIRQSLNQLGEKDVDLKLKIAELFIVYLQDLRSSRDLLIEVIQSRNNTEIDNILMTLVQKDLYIKPIIYFLLNAKNNSPLIEQLALDYLRSPDFSFQEKAILLLKSVNPNEVENNSLFTTVLLKLNPPLDLLESYAQHLTDLEASSDSYIEICEDLIKKKTQNYQLASLLLDKALRSDPVKIDIGLIHYQLIQFLVEGDTHLYLHKGSKNNIVGNKGNNNILTGGSGSDCDNGEDSDDILTGVAGYDCDNGEDSDYILINDYSDVLTGGKNTLKIKKSVRIERNTRIKFPSSCVLNQKVELKIQLTIEIPEFTRVLEKIALTVGLNTKQIKLNVNVTAPGFAIRPYQQQLTIPVKVIPMK